MNIDLNSIIQSEDNRELDKFLAKNKHNIDFKSFKKTNSEIKHKKPKIPTTIVKKSSLHGKGVFSEIEIEKNSIVEICHMIELEFRDKYHKDKTLLNYCYTVVDNDDTDSLSHGNKIFLLTGNGMMYNHSEKNNAIWKINKSENTAILLSHKKILAGQEITINYGNGYWRRNFEHKN
jgi:hypothetical protein